MTYVDDVVFTVDCDCCDGLVFRLLEEPAVCDECNGTGKKLTPAGKALLKCLRDCVSVCGNDLVEKQHENQRND